LPFHVATRIATTDRLLVRINSSYELLTALLHVQHYALVLFRRHGACAGLFTAT
jgi:hypothetical protein